LSFAFAGHVPPHTQPRRVNDRTAGPSAVSMPGTSFVLSTNTREDAADRGELERAVRLHVAALEHEVAFGDGHR
jgi:hypothetical protein